MEQVNEDWKENTRGNKDNKTIAKKEEEEKKKGTR